MGTQMKFVYLALIAGASAIKLHQKPAHLAHAPATSNLVKIASHLKNKIAKHEACPSPEEKEEVEAWFAEVMADGVLTKEEGAAGLQAAADHAGHEITPAQGAEAIFDAIDTNNDGGLDMDELMAVAAEAEAEYK